jgi:hypothetical protein
LIRSLAIAFILLVLAIVAFLSMRTPSLFLVTKGAVSVYATEAASKSRGLAPLRTLPASTRVEVMSCIDAKHYMLYQVRLSDGSIGFINDGNYDLEGPNGIVAASCQ